MVVSLVATVMEERWNEYTVALESGESDRVNGVIDEIKDLGREERLQLLEICFDDLTDIYADSDDGYVRQSVVRVVDSLWMGIAMVVAIENDSVSISREDVRKWNDTFCGFLLEALTDDDGRVRNAAKRALKDCFRTYDSLEDRETIEALAVELDEMAAEYSGKQRKHLLEAKEDAEFFLQSGFGRIVQGFQKEFGDSLNPGGGT